MLNQLLKVGALIATGRFLKPRLKGLLWVAAVWLLLWYAHSEYVEYVQLSDDTSFVWKAALLKTLLYALSIAVYVLRVERPLWPRPLKVPPPQPAAGNSAGSTARPATRNKATVDPAAGDDGFDFLRHKPKLRSPADTLLERNK